MRKTTKLPKIYTLRDAIREKYEAEARRDLILQRKVLKAKVAHWEQRVAEYGGEIQLATLNKFKKLLEAL